MIFRRRKPILLGSLVMVLVAAVFALPVFGELGNENDFDDPSAEAVTAREAVVAATGTYAAPQLVALVRLDASADSAFGLGRIRTVARAMEHPGVASVVAYQPGGDRRLVSKDGRSTYLLATYREDERGATDAIEARLRALPFVTLGGGAIAAPQVGDQVSADILRAELIAFPILFLLSLLVFRSAVSALLPLAVGGATILLTFLAIRLINTHVNPMSIYALNLVNGLGLGLAIDYSLFMVSRFREELAAGRSREEALAVTMRTAGHVVLFSAVTVAAALAALIVFRQRFLYSMGVGGALCALIAAGVSLTLLPALLGALGERVNAGGPRRWKDAIAREAAAERTGFWYRHSRRVMRRPLPFALGAAALLIALGLPFLRIEFTGVDASVLPKDQSARIVDDAIKAEFPPSETSPVYVAVRPGVSEAELERFAARLPAPVSPPEISAGRIDLIAPGPALGAAAKDLVRDARAVEAPFDFWVGGQTAQFVDQQASLADHLPVALALLCATTLLILFVMLRSIVLPVKALVMNLLTICAAFGLMVLVFQDGHLDWLFRFDSQGAIESSQPVLLFAVAFGLSTDYGVFLLGRIKELHDGGMSNEEAVALGLQRTGRIVTFAAALMVVALGCFVTASVIFIKQLGFGVAVAVLIDATIVRALLVPALMRLLGDWNWWVPRPIGRLLGA
ncbi:efflux RND transporter permease subunit [Solirubrobacter phytolaccae]|uniref:Efflux RND transporter permease subunit n=1 Tax=Solirubrobacter phytolaccae TaxID=1404360 RepID=A0A9X3NAY8_9ACTN|nr:efflux RND transporter permease subunit [Solirubrobacter phytolaccae]MDA0182626.1 efflux RND transporter permease subunit [Solirubrobacter phytolaccae]